MKRTILYSLVFIIISVFVGCTGKDKPFVRSEPKSIKTLIFYNNGSGVGYTIAYREQRDTFDLVYSDSLHGKKQWTRYSVYSVPLVDTARDVKGIALKTVAGKDSFAVRMVYPNKNVVLHDVGLDLDSLNNKYTPAKKDSTTH